MALVESHTSPDGVLRLVVCLSEDGDLSVGFDGCPWHTHGDILAAESGLSVSAAVRAFVDDILSSRTILVISRINGVMQDAWIMDDPAKDETLYAVQGETVEKRHWDGRSAG
jgi:hypothetical protein